MPAPADRNVNPSPIIGCITRGRTPIALARLLAPAVLMLSIAWPEHTHFEIDRTPPSQESVARLQEAATDALLEEIAGFDLGLGFGIAPANRRAAAEQILAGRLVAPAFSASPVVLRGWPEDLQVDGPTFQLAVAAFASEALLLEQFERHRDRRFYLAARDRILAFARWEKHQRRPPTALWMLWNDHAVAARIATLVRLWRHLRADPSASQADRAEIVALVARSGELLTKHSQFTVRTNHGVMQNVALLQITAAFSSLPQVARWRKLAAERLDLQLGFYVSLEGIVLEHSAGYHVLGSELLAYALRLLYLNSLEPSDGLIAATRDTQEFNRLLLRPDGSLPAFGNTAAQIPATLRSTESRGRDPVSTLAPPFAVPSASTHLYPVSGYAIWWSGPAVPSQTVVAWAKHEQHGHKHADEPSLLFWSRGYDWITGTGYWPYGHPLHGPANGWQGANAPHRVGEPADSPRDVSLLASGNNEGLRFIEVENLRSDGLLVRRQVIQIEPETLLVVDFHSGAGTDVETLWTVDPRLRVAGTGGNNFVANAPHDFAWLTLSVTGVDDESITTELQRGSSAPFGGWVVVGPHPTPASAVRVRYRKDSGASATLLSVQAPGKAVEIGALEADTAEKWRVEATLPQGVVAVARSGVSVAVTVGGRLVEIALAPPPDHAAASHRLRDAMTRGVEEFPPWRDLSFYTRRLYFAIAVLWLTIELGLLLLGRRRRRMWLEALPILAWAAIALWVHLIYLV